MRSRQPSNRQRYSRENASAALHWARVSDRLSHDPLGDSRSPPLLSCNTVSSALLAREACREPPPGGWPLRIHLHLDGKRWTFDRTKLIVRKSMAGPPIQRTLPPIIIKQRSRSHRYQAE